MRRTAHAPSASKRNDHPGDFVFEVGEGDGKNDEWGIYDLECRVEKFFTEQ